MYSLQLFLDNSHILNHNLHIHQPAPHIHQNTELRNLYHLINNNQIHMFNKLVWLNMLSKAVSMLYIYHWHYCTFQQGNSQCMYYCRNDILLNHRMCSYLMMLNKSYSFVCITYIDHLFLNNWCLCRCEHILNYLFHNLKNMYLHMINKWLLDLNKFGMDLNKVDTLRCKHNIRLDILINKFC